MSLTTEGRVYYERSQALLADLDEVERNLSQGAASTGGRVRVSASVGFGMVAVEPLLPAFWATYPNVVVDLSLSDDIVDLYLDRTDLAFRIGPLSNSSLTARKLGSSLPGPSTIWRCTAASASTFAGARRSGPCAKAAAPSTAA